MLIADLTIAKLCNQPRCQIIDEWISKIWYMYSMEYYSAIKKNEIMSFTGKWMEVEIILLHELNQAHISHVLTHLYNLDLK
jgi:hypothetical protein